MSKYAIQATAINGVLFSGMRGYQLDRGNEIKSEGSDGTVGETMHSIIQVKAVAELESLASRSLLAAMTGSTHHPMLVLDGANGVQMVIGKASSLLAGYAAGTVHPQRQGKNGCVYIRSMKWSLGDYLKTSLKALFTSTNGTTTSVLAADATLPTQVYPTERLTLTALQVGGNALNVVRSVDLEIDPKFDFDFTLGLPYPTDLTGAGVKGHLAVTMAIDADDMEIGEGTGACSAQYTLASANSAVLAATGLTTTLNGAWGIEENWGAEQGTPGSRRLVVRSVYTSVLNALTWGTF